MEFKPLHWKIVLYELTRHSDHHYKASKKYQLLENITDSPQLPFGYPTSIYWRCYLLYGLGL